MVTDRVLSTLVPTPFQDNCKIVCILVNAKPELASLRKKRMEKDVLTKAGKGDVGGRSMSFY